MGKNTMRFKLQEKAASRDIRDEHTGEVPFWARGDDMEIELALADHSGKLLLAADITGSVEFVVRSDNALETDPKLITDTFASVDCDGEYTENHWTNKSSQLTKLEFDRTICNLDVPTGKTVQSYLAYAVHTDADDNKTTFGPVKVQVRRVPHAAATLATPDPPEEVPLTPAQGDARYLRFRTDAADTSEMTTRGLWLLDGTVYFVEADGEEPEVAW